MKSTSLIFALVMVVPLMIAFYYIILKDKQKGKLGFLITGIIFLAAIIISYYVNRNK